MHLNAITILRCCKPQRVERVAHPALRDHLKRGAREPREDVDLYCARALLGEVLLEDGAQLVRDAVERGRHALNAGDREGGAEALTLFFVLCACLGVSDVVSVASQRENDTAPLTAPTPSPKHAWWRLDGRVSERVGQVEKVGHTRGRS